MPAVSRVNRGVPVPLGLCRYSRVRTARNSGPAINYHDIIPFGKRGKPAGSGDDFTRRRTINDIWPIPNDESRTRAHRLNRYRPLINYIIAIRRTDLSPRSTISVKQIRNRRSGRSLAPAYCYYYRRLRGTRLGPGLI